MSRRRGAARKWANHGSLQLAVRRPSEFNTPEVALRSSPFTWLHGPTSSSFLSIKPPSAHSFSFICSNCEHIKPLQIKKKGGKINILFSPLDPPSLTRPFAPPHRFRFRWRLSHSFANDSHAIWWLILWMASFFFFLVFFIKIDSRKKGSKNGIIHATWLIQCWTLRCCDTSEEE